MFLSSWLLRMSTILVISLSSICIYLLSTFNLDVNCDIDVRKLLLLLMNCRSGCMISTFSASGIVFYPSEKVKICFSFILSLKFLKYDYLFWWTSTWMENLVD
jgi:hypothetical protein